MEVRLHVIPDSTVDADFSDLKISRDLDSSLASALSTSELIDVGEPGFCLAPRYEHSCLTSRWLAFENALVFEVCVVRTAADEDVPLPPGAAARISERLQRAGWRDAEWSSV